MWVHYHDGTETWVDPYLSWAFGSDGERPWLSDMIGRGTPFITVTTLFSRSLYSGGLNYLVMPPALRLYDVRKDSTAGGSGSHRWSDPSTWEPTYSPAVIIYNIIRGVYYDNGAGYKEWIFGGQDLPAFRLPAASWMAAMNECDRQIQRADGEWEAQFMCGYEVRTSDEPLAVIEELLKSCCGRLAEVGGIFKLQIGIPGSAVYAFDDGSVVITQGQSFEPFPPLDRTHNTIEATYPEWREGWANKAAPRYVDPDLVAADGHRELPVALTFAAVPFDTQVQRLQYAFLREERRFRTHAFWLPPEAWLLEPNDLVAWTSARNGYVSKLFRVVSIDGERNINQRVVLIEIDPSDYDWDSDFEVPTVVGPVGPVHPAPQPIIDWFVEGATQEINGKQRPGALLTWDGSATDVQRVIWEFRDPSTLEIVHTGGTDSPERGSAFVSQNLFSNTSYQARGKYQPWSGRTTLWSDWLSFVTPDTPFNDVYDIDLDQLSGRLQDLAAWSGQGRRETERRLEEIELRIADQELGNAYDRQAIRQQMTATYDFSRAEWHYEVTLVATATDALAQRTEVLEAEVHDPATGLSATASALSQLTAYAGPGGTLATDVTELNTEVFDPSTGLSAVAGAVDILEAYAGPDGTLANAITQLSASQTPGEVAEANFRMGVVSGPTGYSRVVFQTRYGGSGGWRGAAMGLDTPSNPANPTLMWADAEQFAFMDTSSGSMSPNPLVYSGGVWRMNVAHIGYITSGVIEGDVIASRTLSADKLVLNGITYTELQSGAVTYATYYDQIAPIGTNIGSTPTTIVAQATINGLAGFRRQIRFSCSVSGNGNGGEMTPVPDRATIHIYVRRGGSSGPIIRYIDVQLTGIREEGAGTRSAEYAGQVFVECVDYGGSATQTYTVQMSRDANSVGTNTASYRFMTIDEYRA